MEVSTEKRLRLRLRVVDAQQRGKVDVPAACTLQQLKAAVQHELRVNGDHFDVSLDKKTLLTGASARLTALGVCPGDMLWVHTQQGAAPMECEQSVQRCNAPAPPAGTAAPSAPARHSLLAAGNTLYRPIPRQACADAAEARSRAAEQEGKRQKAEPASDAAQPPQPGSRLVVVQQGSGILQVAAVVHAVAVDCGLEGLCPPEAQEAHSLPVCAHPSANSISLQYRLAGADASTASAVATMHCSRMGSHILVAGRATAADGGAAGIVHHASAAWRPVDRSAGSTANVPSTAAAVPGSSRGSRPDTVSLDRLLHDASSIAVALKDGVTLPLVADLCRAACVAVPFGLLSLPSELRIIVMEMLSPKDLARLTCVCAELREAGSANGLWRGLFEAEFGEASLAEATAGAHGWKALFRARWRHREEYRSARQSVPPHPLFRGGRPPGTPFIIGGYLDRLPLPFQPLRMGRGNRGAGMPTFMH